MSSDPGILPTIVAWVALAGIGFGIVCAFHLLWSISRRQK